MLLAGCALPAAWAGQPHWRILETRFGHGRGFLSVWQAWRDDPHRAALLHFVSVAPQPGSADDLLRGAARHPALQDLAEALAARWRGLTPGFHRLVFDQGRVLLTLCVGDLASMLREQAFRADTVFLDGLHAPGGPPAAAATLRALTRLCRRGTRIGGADASDAVRRDLQACGWKLESPPGAPLSGRYDPGWEPRDAAADPVTTPARALVVGAGLAGAAAAASLARRGWSVLVVDAAASPASGASALPAGLMAPHQSPDDNPLSRLSRAGIRLTLQEAQERLARGLEWGPTGVLELRGNDRRSVPAIDALGTWTRDASGGQKRSAGLPVDAAAWWHEDAAWIEPAALVRSWLRTPGVRFQGGWQVAPITRGGQRWEVADVSGTRVAEVELVVVAAALGSRALLRERIQVQPVRGQVSWGPRGDDAALLPPFPVNGNGHLLPDVPLFEGGAWITGSTYGRGDADAALRSADDAANVERVRAVLPGAAAALDAVVRRGAVRSWAGVRCASTDRRPLVGEVEPGLWVSTAMGSRGLSFAALCAELLAARLHHEPWPLELRLAQALDAGRQRH